MKRYVLIAFLSTFCMIASAQSLVVDFTVTPSGPICEGDTVWLTDISTTTGGSGVAFREWDAGGLVVDDIAAPTTFAVAVTTTGGSDYFEHNVKLSLQDSTGAYDEELKFSHVHVDQPISYLTTSATSLNICEGDTTQLLATNSGSDWFVDSWDWSPSGSVDTASSQNPMCFPSTSQTYTVTAVNGTCSSSETITITVNPLPATPTITQVGNDLQSSVASGNQWYMNGNIMSGEINQTLTPTASGSYTVEVTNGYGCKSESAPYSFTYVGLEEYAGQEYKLAYPNPVESNLMVSPEFGIKIMNSLGQTVDTYPVGTTNIDMSSFNTGIYLIQFSDDNRIHTMKVKKM